MSGRRAWFLEISVVMAICAVLICLIVFIVRVAFGPSIKKLNEEGLKSIVEEIWEGTGEKKTRETPSEVREEEERLTEDPTQEAAPAGRETPTEEDP